MIAVAGTVASFYATVLGGSERIGANEETNITRYFRYISNFNTGFMRSLQSNPNDRNTDCMDKTKATNLKIAEVADEKTYTGGEIGEGEFIEKFQVAAIVGMEQFDHCGINEFLISMDGMLNNWSSLAGSASALTTQIIVGYSTSDTSVYKSVNQLNTSWGNADWEGIGLGTSLLISQVLKYEAPDASINVNPTTK